MDEAEQTEVEETTEQESPTVEQNQPEGTPEGDAPEKEDKNWKAVREELAALKAEKEQWLKSQQPEAVETTPKAISQRTDLNLLMSADDKVELRILEARAEAEFGDALESDAILRRAVEGEYIAALSDYNQAVLEGKKTALPNPYRIAKKVKKDFDERFGAVSKKAEVEGAKKAQQAKQSKEATVEAEGRSDRAKNTQSAEDMQSLQLRSRRGDDVAIAERLSRSGL